MGRFHAAYGEGCKDPLKNSVPGACKSRCPSGLPPIDFGTSMSHGLPDPHYLRAAILFGFEVFIARQLVGCAFRAKRPTEPAMRKTAAIELWLLRRRSTRPVRRAARHGQLPKEAIAPVEHRRDHPGTSGGDEACPAIDLRRCHSSVEFSELIEFIVNDSRSLESFCLTR
jgi:hypothetical protein